MIPILFGFILTTWFNAILGSFTTTTLYDKQARTFDDMKNQNIKLAVSDDPLNLFKDISKDLVVFMESEELNNLVWAPNEYAKAMDSLAWNYFLVPFMNFYRRTFYIRGDQNLVTSFLHMSQRLETPHKEQLNRFIELIKDNGLYKHWCDIIYIDLMNSKIFSQYKFYTEQSSIQVLQLDFFTYAYLAWAVGLTLSFIVFLLEVYRLRLRVFYFMMQ